MSLDFTAIWQKLWDTPWFAPWIVESWLDFLHSLAFDLPVLVSDPALRSGLVAVGACGAFVMTWVAVSQTPRVARRAARLLAALVFLAPAALVGALQLEADFKRLQAEAEHGPPAPQSVAAPAAPVTPPVVAPPVVVAKSSAQDEHAVPAYPPVAAVAAAVQPDLPAPLAAPPLETAPMVIAPAPPPAATPKAPLVRQAAVAPRDVKPPRAAPPPDTVRLFYGTDRAVDPAAEGVDYSAVRGQRLIVGQALVSLPARARLDERPVPVAASLAPTRADALTPVEITPLDHDDGLQALVKQLAQSKRFPDHVLVFVPGFHMTFEAALSRAAQIGTDLGFDGALCVYSWPSAGRVARYDYDAQSAREALPYLKEYIRFVVGETGAKSVSFIGHGLGSQPLIDALLELKGTFPPNAPLTDLILAAPDVDAVAFGDKIASLKDHVGSITLYTSANDRALNLTRRYTGGIPRAGDVLEGGPLVLPGVVTIDVGGASTDAVSLNTTRYVAHAALMGDIGVRVQAMGSPKAAPASLEAISTPRGPYYRLPAVRPKTP